MKTVKKQAFNLIEILIALGILAIGMVAVLGLFPLGFATTRDAMAESSSADAADQMLHMLQFKLKDQTVWTNIIVNHQIPSTKPVANWNTGLPDSDTAWARIEPFTAGCVLKKETSAGVYTPGLYKIIRFATKLRKRRSLPAMRRKVNPITTALRTSSISRQSQWYGKSRSGSISTTMASIRYRKTLAMTGR